MSKVCLLRDCVMRCLAPWRRILALGLPASIKGDRKRITIHCGIQELVISVKAVGMVTNPYIWCRINNPLSKNSYVAYDERYNLNHVVSFNVTEVNGVSEIFMHIIHIKLQCSPLKLFSIFSLRLSVFAWNFASILLVYIYTYLPILVNLS